MAITLDVDKMGLSYISSRLLLAHLDRGGQPGALLDFSSVLPHLIPYIFTDNPLDEKTVAEMDPIIDELAQQLLHLEPQVAETDGRDGASIVYIASRVFLKAAERCGSPFAAIAVAQHLSPKISEVFETIKSPSLERLTDEIDRWLKEINL